MKGTLVRFAAMAILITGGLGVIGSRLAAALRGHGYDVKVTDHRILKQPGYMRADVCEYHELDRVFRELADRARVSLRRRGRPRERRALPATVR